MPHLKQVAGRKGANHPMIRGDRRKAHAFITAVDQHAGFAEIGGQIVNMRIVNTEQDRRLSLRFIHA